jgi:hypothetical protein
MTEDLTFSLQYLFEVFRSLADGASSLLQNERFFGESSGVAGIHMYVNITVGILLT